MVLGWWGAGPKAHRRPSYEPWRGIPMTATLIVLTLLFVVEIGWLVRFSLPTTV
jgi:hypothetical protein